MLTDFEDKYYISDFKSPTLNKKMTPKIPFIADDIFEQKQFNGNRMTKFHLTNMLE